VHGRIKLSFFAGMIVAILNILTSLGSQKQSMEDLQKRHHLAEMKIRNQHKKDTDFRTLRRLDKELMKQVLGRKVTALDRFVSVFWGLTSLVRKLRPCPRDSCYVGPVKM